MATSNSISHTHNPSKINFNRGYEHTSPLRFKVGAQVIINIGTLAPGTVVKLWDQGLPYQVKLSNGKMVWVTVDTNDVIGDKFSLRR